MRVILAAVTLVVAVAVAFLVLAGTAGNGRQDTRAPRAGDATARTLTKFRRERHQPQAYATLPAPARAQVHLRFRPPPASGLLFDLKSGRVLWARGVDRVLPIASVTKMMTALLAVTHLPRHSRVLITHVALHFQGSAVGVLPLGRRIDVETLLYGLLLPSGNDAARALAQRVGGTVPGFVRLMNAKARALGLRCTHFTSPDGFHNAGNHSCAPDLAVLAREVLAQPRLARIVATRKVVLPLPIRARHVELYNNNPLLLSHYPGTEGVKTGFTNQAGSCLVAVARHGHARLGVVLLHSPNTGSQARKLLDAGFRAERRAAG